MALTSSQSPRRVALETTILAHGAPRELALQWAEQIENAVASSGAAPATIGVYRGHSVIGMTRAQLESFLNEPVILKANSANLAAAQFQGQTAATTVSATIELAARNGVSLMATGGIGGVHRSDRLDVSSDLIALTRWPVAVVCSGCKAFLDVIATRETLETLGVPVIGWRADRFPAFYLRDGGCDVDARFDDETSLAAFIRKYTVSSGRGVIIANPISEEDAIDPADWRRWLAQAQKLTPKNDAHGRDATPRLLAALHKVSGGATLGANLALVIANARLAGRLAMCS